MGPGRSAGGDRSNETVAALRKSFDETRIVGLVGERVAEFVDSSVQAVFEIDEGVFGPEALLELLAGDDHTGLFEEDGQDLERPILDFEADAGFAEFAGEQVGFVRAEADDRGKLGRGGHELSCW
jgi:hypothetical protein